MEKGAGDWAIWEELTGGGEDLRAMRGSSERAAKAWGWLWGRGKVDLSELWGGDRTHERSLWEGPEV